jgi:hypothetical protein
MLTLPLPLSRSLALFEFEDDALKPALVCIGSAHVGEARIEGVGDSSVSSLQLCLIACPRFPILHVCGYCLRCSLIRLAHFPLLDNDVSPRRAQAY